MIKVYYIKIEEAQKKWLPEFINKVQKQRRSKVLRCKNELAQWRSLSVELLLRFALKQEGFDYEKLEFTVEEYGKPILRNQECFFSLTHSKHYVACVISDEKIGIDVEERNRKLFSAEREVQLISMTKRVCTQTEYRFFKNMPKEEWSRIYLELWTRKESFAKADGRGLAIGIEQIEVLETEGFETIWITEDVCMSIYSEHLKRHTCIYKQLYVEQLF